MASSCKPDHPKMMPSYYCHRCYDPCCVCGTHQPCYDHFCPLTSEEKQFIKKHACSDTYAVYVMLITGEQNRINLTLNTFLPGKGGIKGRSTLQHVTFLEFHATSLTEKIIPPSDKT